MKREQAEERLPEWLLERLVAGDLSPEREAEARRRLALEPDGVARLEALAKSNQEVLEAHPAATVVNQIADRAHLAARLDAARAKPRGRGWMFAVVPPVLALGSLGLMVALRAPKDGRETVVGAETPSSSGEADTDIIKGSPMLRVYRRLGDRVQRLQSDAAARPGDQLQLSYVAGGKQFGAVLSVDGAGKVTFHLPADAGPAVKLRGGREVSLSASYELDAAPGFERFIFVTSDAPFDSSALADVATGKAPAPAGTSTTSFTVRKE